MATVPRPARSLPQFSPGPRELDDVELLRMGVLSPRDGFEGPDSGVTLTVPPPVAALVDEAGELEVVDPEGVPLAVVSVEDTYPRPGGHTGLVGTVRPLSGIPRRAFGDLYLPPSWPRTQLGRDTVTIPVLGALTESDLTTIAEVVGDAPVLFLVLAGYGAPHGLSRHGLIRATKLAASRFPGSTVVAVPAAARERPADDDEFRHRVVHAYAPGSTVHWPSGEGAAPADVEAVVRADRPTGLAQGLVVFFTGLSGSGKSTIAQALRDRVLESGERTVSLLDGDRVRHNLSRGLTFSREDRETNIERIGWVAAEIAGHGAFAICSPIAPFDRTRKAARTMVTDVGAAFVLVHVATPLEECEARDRKGLYAKARRGDIPDFTGISSPYEVPDDAEMIVDTTGRSVEAVLDEVLAHLVDHGWLRSSVLDGTATTEGAAR